MKKNLHWRLALIIATAVLSLVFFLPSTSYYDSMPDWYKSSMPSKGIVLGLDLQGGLHLVFEVEAERAVEITAERIAQGVAEELKKSTITAGVEAKGLEVTIKPIGNTSPALIEQFMKSNYGRLDLKESTQAAVVYAISDAEAKSIRENAVDQALETIRNRIDQFGVAEPNIHRQAEREIVVQLPGVKDPQRAIELIGKTAQLEFKMLDEETSLISELPGRIKPEEEEALRQSLAPKLPEGTMLYFERVEDKESKELVAKIPYLVKNKVLLTGDLLSEAGVALDQRIGNKPYVSMTFNAEGARIFEDITRENVQKRLAIILDGNIYSAPVIREPIAGGNASISGGFSLDEAKDLSIVLRAGALPAPVNMLQNITVGPSLGRDSIDAGKTAGMVGAVLVVIFMIVYYKAAGAIADVALALNILLLLGSMAVLKATLTLPGIAGVILAIGMAVDSNVLMFERMREELRAGKTPLASIDSGYHKAFWTIFDSHITTLITSFVLYQYGTGPIKGFAVTLGLGVAINLYTALIGTKTLFDLVSSRKEIKRLSI